MDAERQLDDAEVGREMSAGLRDRGDELVADLLGELRELRPSDEPLDVARALYASRGSVRARRIISVVLSVRT